MLLLAYCGGSMRYSRSVLKLLKRFTLQERPQQLP